MRAERLKEALKNHPTSDILPSMIPMSDEIQPLLGDVLDSMNMRRSCCRQKLLTTSLFSEYY